MTGERETGPDGKIDKPNPTSSTPTESGAPSEFHSGSLQRMHSAGPSDKRLIVARGDEREKKGVLGLDGEKEKLATLEAAKS